MTRTSNAFSVLQAISAVAGLAILMWSIGFPSFHFAEAANVTNFSDTLSDSAPSADSNHTIQFTTPSGVANGSTITITFPPQFTGTSSIVATDIDVATTSDFTVGAACGAVDVSASFNGTNTLTLTMCVAGGKSIPSNGTTTIQIGTNASGGSNQINNPATPNPYEINLTAGASDSGSTRVAIIQNVLVTASVDTLFTFAVYGRPAGTSVNGAHTTGGATTATDIPFGQIDAGVASTAAQMLEVTTNAKSGFVVTVTSDGQLESSTGADIDGYINGAYTTTPTAWTAPSGTLGQENTYGHWGLTSDDPTLTSGLSDLYGTGLYVSASTTPVEVFRHNGPSAGTGLGVGTTTVGYRIQRTALQEAAEDYQAVLTYVATPVF